MSPHTDRSCLSLGEAPKAGPFPRQNDAWDVLERFAREVPNYEQSSELIPLTLQAIRQATGADTVYWCPDAGSEPVPIIGGPSLSSEWCRHFVQKLLQETPGVDNCVLRADLAPPALRWSPAPRSAAMVRMSKSRSLWLVALSFDPARLFRTRDVKIMTLARQIFFNQRRRCQLHSRMSDTLHWLAQCMTTTIEARLPYIRGHSERVAQIAARLGRQMHLPSPVISDLYFAGLLHDIGKVGISETVLLKPGQLSHEEFAQIKEYPVIGDRLLANIKQLGHLRAAVRNHRERFDGCGYPDRLAGDDIPLIARVLSVADACDAMMSPRPYRPALPTQQIDAILADGAGKQWDPFVVEHFMACRADVYPLCRTTTLEAAGPDVGRMAVAAWNVDSSTVTPARGTDTAAAPSEKVCVEARG